MTQALSDTGINENFLEEEEEKKVKEQTQVIHVTEMPPPIQRLSERLDRLMTFVERVCNRTSVAKTI